jgi:hypothetical protein
MWDIATLWRLATLWRFNLRGNSVTRRRRSAADVISTDRFGSERNLDNSASESWSVMRDALFTKEPSNGVIPRPQAGADLFNSSKTGCVLMLPLTRIPSAGASSSITRRSTLQARVLLITLQAASREVVRRWCKCCWTEERM